MGPHFMLLLSIYVLYSNITYVYPVSCLVEIKLFQIVSNCFVSLLTFFFCCYVLFHSCSSRVQVLGTTLVHEFHISDNMYCIEMWKGTCAKWKWIHFRFVQRKRQRGLEAEFCQNKFYANQLISPRGGGQTVGVGM